MQTNSVTDTQQARLDGARDQGDNDEDKVSKVDGSTKKRRGGEDAVDAPDNSVQHQPAAQVTRVQLFYNSNLVFCNDCIYTFYLGSCLHTCLPEMLFCRAAGNGLCRTCRRTRPKYLRVYMCPRKGSKQRKLVLLRGLMTKLNLH